MPTEIEPSSQRKKGGSMNTAQVHTVIEAQLPGGKPLPSHIAPKFAMRHSTLETIWNEEDPKAELVTLEYRYDEWTDEADRRYTFQVCIDNQSIHEPLPSAMLTEPTRSGELREYIRRSRKNLDARTAQPVRDRVRRWLRGLVPDRHAQARDALEQRYREEAHETVLIKHLAASMTNPQLQTRLLNIERRKRSHLERLETLIRHFEGKLPPFESLDLSGRTWQGLSTALLEESHDVESYHELRPLLQDDPDNVALLELMIDDERANKKDLVDVMSKLDPYANGAFVWPADVGSSEQPMLETNS
jgi:hypothetical protein